MAFDFSAYFIASHEKPADSAKMNQFIQASEDGLNNLPISSIVGYPSNAAYYPDGSGNWSIPPGSGTASAGGWSTTADTFTFSSLDDKTFVMNTVSDATTRWFPGMRLRMHQLGETDYRYFIVTAVTATKVTVWGGTDYVVDNSTISDATGSTDRFPQGFPTDPAKWTHVDTDTTDQLVNHHDLAADVWFNIGGVNFDVPIGSWFLSYVVVVQTGGTQRYAVTLSTGAASESSSTFTTTASGVSSGASYPTFQRTGMAVLAAKTTYYLNLSADDEPGQNVHFRGDVVPTYLQALSTYF